DHPCVEARVHRVVEPALDVAREFVDNLRRGDSLLVPALADASTQIPERRRRADRTIINIVQVFERSAERRLKRGRKILTHQFTLRLRPLLFQPNLASHSPLCASHNVFFSSPASGAYLSSDSTSSTSAGSH